MEINASKILLNDESVKFLLLLKFVCIQSLREVFPQKHKVSDIVSPIMMASR